jgi:multiple sugar transport system substrate-binding protein
MVHKRGFKIVVMSLILATMLAMGVAAQGNGVAAQDDLAGTKIVVALRSLPETDFIVERVPDFKEQTGIDVEIVTFGEQQLREKTVQDLSTGAGQYDVIAVDSVFVPEFAENGWLFPLDDLVTEEYNIDDLPESVRGLLSRDGSLYGVPIYAEITQLLYRKDLFEEAGLEPPTTFEELETVAAYFTENVEGVDGLAMRGLRGNGMNVYIWSEWLRSYGGEYLNENSEPIFNNEAGVAATENYASLLQNYGPEGVASFAWDDVQTAFATGQVAMVIDANNFYTRIEDPDKSEIVGLVGYANVPAGPEGAFPGNYTLGFGISAVGATSDKEQRASAAFLMWATSAEMQMASIDAGIVSQTRTSVLTSDTFQEAFPADWLESTIESWAMTNPQYRPLFNGWRSMGDRIGIAVQEVIAGQKDAKTALDEAAAEVKDNFELLGLLGQPRPYPAIFD